MDKFQSSTRQSGQSGQSGQFAKQFGRQDEIEHESGLTRTLENQASRLPAVSWLGLAVGSMVASAALEIFSERKELGNFVGLWAPSFLLIGIYNKIVKIEHSQGGLVDDRHAA